MNTQAPHTYRILLVDDNPAIHDDFRKILSSSNPAGDALESAEIGFFGQIAVKQKLPRFEIDSAYQGEEALRLIEKSLVEERPYTMAFMDVRMPPGWDGIQTTVNIWERYPDLQVVICTAYSDYSWDRMVERLGYSDKLLILKKPFDVIEICQFATALTEKWRLHQVARAQTGRLEELVAQRTSALRAANLELTTANVQLTAANTRLRAALSAAETMA